MTKDNEEQVLSPEEQCEMWEKMIAMPGTPFVWGADIFPPLSILEYTPNEIECNNFVKWKEEE